MKHSIVGAPTPSEARNTRMQTRCVHRQACVRRLPGCGAVALSETIAHYIDRPASVAAPWTTQGETMLDSLEIQTLLEQRGFEPVDARTHAIGFVHPDLTGHLIYLKDGRDRRDAPRKAVRKQPLVVHPAIADLPGFATSRAVQLGGSRPYMNSNMTAFPNRDGKSAQGVAMGIVDAAALDEVLTLHGWPGL